MRSIGSTVVVLLAFLLAGCGSGDTSSPRQGDGQAGDVAAAAAEQPHEGGGASADRSDHGSYNGLDLCDLDQIEEEVRALYEVDPATQVICRPARRQANVVAAWNWWVVQPEEPARVHGYKNEAQIEKMTHELVGEKATGERVEVGIGDNHVGGEDVWAREKHNAGNPANELELIEVNGRDAIWGAHYLLLTPINDAQTLAIATLAGYTEAGPADGEPTAISIAELVEKETF